MSNPTGKGGFKDNPDHQNRHGRPPGATDKHFVRVETWLARYFEDLEEIDITERLLKMEWVLEKFFSKIAGISASPEESAARAKSAAELLSGLEQRPPVPDQQTVAAPPLPPGTQMTNGSNGVSPH